MNRIGGDGKYDPKWMDKLGLKFIEMTLVIGDRLVVENHVMDDQTLDTVARMAMGQLGARAAVYPSTRERGKWTLQTGILNEEWRRDYSSRAAAEMAAIHHVGERR